MGRAVLERKIDGRVVLERKIDGRAYQREKLMEGRIKREAN